MYFGEGLTSYSVVDSKVAGARGERRGYATNDDAVLTATGGVQGQELRRAALAFALRFGDFNLVYSGQVTTASRILYLRDIQERVQTAAPFLQWDADPYAVNLGGKIVWVLDGYTTHEPVPVLAVDQPRRAPGQRSRTRTSTTCATR